MWQDFFNYFCYASRAPTPLKELWKCLQFPRLAPLPLFIDIILYIFYNAMYILHILIGHVIIVIFFNICIIIYNKII